MAGPIGRAGHGRALVDRALRAGPDAAGDVCLRNAATARGECRLSVEETHAPLDCRARVAIAALWQRASELAPKYELTPMFAGLDANDVAALRVQSRAGTFNVRRDRAHGWTIPEKAGFPADAAQVRATILMKDGRRLETFVEHAVGSPERPMSDAALETKFAGLADGILPAARARKLMDLCWSIDALPEVAILARAGGRSA